MRIPESPGDERGWTLFHPQGELFFIASLQAGNLLPLDAVGQEDGWVVLVEPATQAGITQGTGVDSEAVIVKSK